MRPFFLTSLLVAAAAAFPSPANVNVVSERGQKTVLEISYCNQCTDTLSCTQTQYIHTKKEGEGGHGNCNTPPTYFNDACSADGQIKTPFGDGDFTPVDGCDTNAPDGTLQGHIMGLANGGGVFRFTCYKTYQQYSVFCGFNFACHVYLRCLQG
ncbi:hypothetical protein K4F52_002054 [Lecanicillium sp. MT-2017a]|nr:hypothetical protein K4F52_002054 [Lecanicillium sp. MT-2017a]